MSEKNRRDCAPTPTRAFFAAAVLAALLRLFRRRARQRGTVLSGRTPAIPPGHESTPFHAHEERDANVRSVVIVGLILAVVLGLVIASPLLIIPWLHRSRPLPLSTQLLPRTAQLPPQPRLRSQEQRDLTVEVAGRLRRLNSYGWLDRNRGLIHIPIERAMDLVARQSEADEAVIRAPALDAGRPAAAGEPVEEIHP